MLRFGLGSWLLPVLLVPVALAHGYHAGSLEIVHPAIIAPAPGSDCTCAHVKIVNHGTRTAYFLGAIIDAANRTHLLAVSGGGAGLSLPSRVAIPPGATLDLNRPGWCLSMSGIAAPLEAGFGAIPGALLFEGKDPVKIEFMIDAEFQ